MRGGEIVWDREVMIATEEACFKMAHAKREVAVRYEDNIIGEITETITVPGPTLGPKTGS
jgi:hypothetical protein